MQVREALLFSASLRLQGNPSTAATQAFTDEVMDIVELTPLANALVGAPGMDTCAEIACICSGVYVR